MSKLIIALVAASAFFASSAIAAPLNPATTAGDSGVERVRMVCDQSGRCWRERGAGRVVDRRESYGYDRRRHHHHHDRGPAVGIHAPGVSIGIGDGGRRW